MFKCDICNIDFKAKQSLIRHQNKLTKCDHITKFKCNNCNKYFKRKQTLKEHIELVCGIKFINDQLDELNNITNILNFRLTTDAKIDLLINNHKIKLTKATIKEIIECQTISDSDKVKLFLNKY